MDRLAESFLSRIGGIDRDDPEALQLEIAGDEVGGPHVVLRDAHRRNRARPGQDRAQLRIRIVRQVHLRVVRHRPSLRFAPVLPCPARSG